MLVGFSDQPRVFGTIVFSPDLLPSQEKTLLRRKTIDLCRCRFAFERFQERRMGDGHTPKVGDAFAFLQLSISVEAWLDFVRIELFGNAVAACLKILQVLGRPPVAQIALPIELRAL